MSATHGESPPEVEHRARESVAVLRENARFGPGLLVFAVALSMGLALLMHRVETGGDNLDYIIQARSLQMGRWGDMLGWSRPAGYSAMIAVVLRLCGIVLPAGPLSVEPLAIYLLKALNIVFFAAAGLAVYLWARQVSRSQETALGVALLFGVNQFLAATASIISAEPAFLTLSFFALYLWEDGIARAGQRSRLLVTAVVLALLVMTVRHQGLALAGAVCLWLAMHRRRSARDMACVVVLGLGMLASLSVQWTGNRFNLAHLVEEDPYRMGAALPWTERLRQALVVYQQSWVNLLVPKVLDSHGLLDILGWTALAQPFVWAVSLLMILGLWVTVRRLGWTLSHMYAVCFGCMLLIWPDVLQRYLIPVAPLGIWLFLEGIRAALGFLFRRAPGPRKPRLAYAVVLGMLLAWSVAVNAFAGVKNWRNIVRLRHEPPWHSERYIISRESDFAEYMSAALWLRDHVPADAVIFCRRASFVELASGRRCEHYTAPASPEALWEEMQSAARSAPCYVLKDAFTKDSTYGRLREQCLAPVLAAHGAYLSSVHAMEGGTEILCVMVEPGSS